MDNTKTTPKDFFLWAGAMITLYISVFSFISLVFDYINYAFPDPLSYVSSDPYSGSISYEMASLIVLFPIFLILMRLIHRSIEIDAIRGDIWVRRWALYLTLFVAGATIAIDLITLIMYFLNGEITTRFILKVLVILLVVGAGFLHFISDLWGYWEKNAAKARLIGWAAGGLVVITIISGFLIIGTPWQARLYRFDQQKVNDLTNVQGQIINYWLTKQKLPASLADLNDSINYVPNIVDPQSGQQYEYHATGPLSFELCANFNAVATQNNQYGRLSAPMPAGGVYDSSTDNWYHGPGHVCFKRSIDPERYPPVKSKV